MKTLSSKSALVAIMATLFLSHNVVASNWGADKVIDIWNNTTAPHSNGVSGDEQIKDNVSYHLTNISTAQLYIYNAKGKKISDKAVIICPGGGYSIVSMLYEGERMAEWFAENGITAAVVKYRLPNGVTEVPFEDVIEGTKILRAESKRLGFDPKKIGIYGASAGGHLAASISTLATSEHRPYFSVLFYPVISSDVTIWNKWSFRSLLGDGFETTSANYSLEHKVDDQTPPAILFHCNDDRSVPSENSTLYYNALRKFKRHSSLYIFPEGGHGWGNNETFEYQKQWQSLLLDWLNKLD